MRDSVRSTLLRYGGAMLAVLLGTAARLALDPVLGDRIPFITLLFVLVVVAGYAGRGPALLATALGAVASAWLLMSPRDSLSLSGPEDRASLALFVAIGTGIAMLGGALRSARLRAEWSANEADRHREALRASEARFQAFMDHCPATAFMKDEGGRYVFVNRRLERLFGRPAADWVGRTDADLFPPVEAEAYRANDRAVLDSGAIAEFEEAVEAPGGALRLRSFKFPLAEASGRRLLAGMSLDVTESRRAEARLREREATLRAFYDSAPACMGIVELTDDGDILHLDDNPATCRFFGVEPGATSGRRATELKAERGVVARSIAAYRESEATGRPVHFEHEFTAPGESRWLSATVCPIGPGPSSRTRFCYIAEEITGRRRHERELAEAHRRLGESHALLDALLASAPVGMAFLDADFRFITINESLAALNGRPVADHIGRSAAEILPTVWPVLEPIYRRVLETGEPLLGRELAGESAWRPDGVRTVVTNTYPVRVEGRGIVGIGVAVVDITERKRVEQALREADRRKDEFLAMLAHELRNPLAPIRNAVSVLAMDGDDREQWHWAREVIDRQLRHLSDLVDDLLDVGRINEGKITLERSPVDLASCVAAAVEASRPLIDARGHRLEVELPEAPLRVEGDATRLTQVIQNLLNNAAKYTPEGGRVRLAVGREGDRATLRVCDDGVGIPAEMLTRVFELFTQVDRSLDRSEGGLGIGLTLVRRLVALHGGTVEARSDGPGRGSEFVVRLPLLADAEASVAAADAPRVNGDAADAPRRRRRILVVDDGRDSAETLARLLRRLGHVVEVAHDGPSACRAAPGFGPDLALLDIGLPGMDGYEVARTLRREPTLVGLSLVALTGYGSESDRRRSAEAGFDDHLVKPVEFDALRAVLDRPGAPLSAARGRRESTAP